MSNRRYNPAVLALLRDAGEVGITRDDVVRQLGIDAKLAGNVLHHLRKTGRIVRERIGAGLQNNLSRYRLAPGDDGMPTDFGARIRAGMAERAAVKPKPAPKNIGKADDSRGTVVKTQVIAKSGSRRLDPAAPAITPPGVKVTIAPPFKDTRFVFDPPPGWRGEISRDGLARRLERT